MNYLEEYGIYTLGVIVALYHVRYPCNRRLYFGMVTFAVCMMVFKQFKESLLVGLVVAISCDIYKKYIRASVEGFKEGEEEEEEEEEEDFTENLGEADFEDYINLQETYKQNVEKLDTKSLEKMTSQTEKFMSQQKELLKVVEKLGPSLKEGMGMLKTFGNLKDSIKP
jgi:hypothetical protein